MPGLHLANIPYLVPRHSVIVVTTVLEIEMTSIDESRSRRTHIDATSHFVIETGLFSGAL